MTRVAFRPSEWPVTVKASALVVALMIAVSAVMTNQVLSRLADTQRRHFAELTASYLDGLSSSLVPAVLRDDVWETFDILDRARSLYRGLTTIGTVVANGNGIVLAAADPTANPSYSRVPTSVVDRFSPGQDVWLDDTRERAGARRILVHQGLTIGVIYAEFDVAGLFRERQAVLWALMGTNTVIALGLAAVGYFSVRRILRPVRVLTHHLHQGATSPASPIPDDQLGSAQSEFGQLFRRYNALVRAMQDRELLAGRLAEEERLASLGRLASGMAHEINNPLGGLFNALDTLKRHGRDTSIRERAISLLERGLSGIRDVVRSTLVTYRVEAPERPLKPADIDDLCLLIKPDMRRRDLTLVSNNELSSDLPVRADAVRQAVLNLLLNACRATPSGRRIWLSANDRHGSLSIVVRDEGAGLDADRTRYLEEADAESAPRPGESGLGLWIVRRLLAELGGRLKVERPIEGGTAIVLIIPIPVTEGMRHVA